MKKGKQTNGKRAAANDKPENGETKTVAPKAKAEKAKTEERYTIGNVATVRGGFYKELCDYVAKKGNSHGVDAEAIRAAFLGRQINGRGINAQRVARYIRYAVNHGQFKVVK